MKIDAREIVRYARRKNLTLLPHSGHSGNGLDGRIVGCALSALAGMQGKEYSNLTDHSNPQYKKYRSLEAGFEDFEFDSERYDIRYYKVGKNVARLIDHP